MRVIFLGLERVRVSLMTRPS